MTSAYVDSSSILALVFQEPGYREVKSALETVGEVFSSNLLEAEVRAAIAREQVDLDPDDILEWISWLHPNRSLTREFRQVLAVDALRGADLWHVASALYLREAMGECDFYSLDRRQLGVARQLGL